MGSNVIILRGLPGAGKSWKSTRIVKATGAVRFNMDGLRETGGFPAGTHSWAKDKEAIAFDMMLNGIVGAVRAGFDVLIDNTHVSNNWPEKYKKALRYEDVVFTVLDLMHVPVETCIERDEQRPDKVGESVIRRMAKTFERNPYKDPQAFEDWLNTPDFELKQYERDPSKPRAVVFDLDGTLALMGDRREPYQFHLVGRDEPNMPVVDALQAHQAAGRRIVLASGRDGGFRQATEDWLNYWGIEYTALFMRSAGDRRKDDQVKHEILHRDIAPRFDVGFWYDDRDQVVKMLRAVGVTVAQVAEGNF